MFQTAYKKNNILIECFSDGALVFHIKRLQIHQLNPTAYQVLNLTDGKRTPKEVGDSIADIYQIDWHVAMNDTSAIYEQMRSSGIVRKVIKFF